jgi:Family of unknown function (DUF5372)
VTVTMPIHPLKGLELKLVGMRREPLSRRQTVIAEAHDGGRIELPVDWTDRGAPWVTPRLGGEDVRLCARGLLALARAVDAAVGCKKFDVAAAASSAWSQTEHASKTVAVSSCHRDGGMGGSDTHDATRRARHLGKSASKDAARKRGRR